MGESSKGHGEFTSYQRIAEDTSYWLADEAQLRRLRRMQWVVTEKIHGANFCLIYTPQAGLECAKRKALLEPGEHFFAHRRVVATVEPQIRALYERVHERDGRVRRVLVYGELFGGAYPHAEVTPIEGLQAIQTGVYYCPEVVFCAFDLAFETEEGAQSHQYVDFPQALEDFEAVGLFCVAPLLVGSWEQALAYEVGFDSTIPARLGLPPMPKGSNKAEGVVIKPVETVYIETRKGRARPILKKKIPEFIEDRRYHQAQPWPEPKAGWESQVDPLALLEWELLSRLNPARVQSAVSKQGRPVTDGQFQALYQAVLDDVWEDTQDAKPEVVAEVQGEDRELLLEVLRDAVEQEVARTFGH